MKPAVAHPWALLLCGLCLGSLSGCGPLDENVSGFRLWVADLPNPLDRDRPRPLSRVTQLGQSGKKVYVKGQVLQLSPLLNGIAYELQDPTGKIWIQTQRQDVTLGETIHVQGQLQHREADLGGLDFGEVYLEELRQVEVDQN